MNVVASSSYGLVACLFRAISYCCWARIWKGVLLVPLQRVLEAFGNGSARNFFCNSISSVEIGGGFEGSKLVCNLKGEGVVSVRDFSRCGCCGVSLRCDD